MIDNVTILGMEDDDDKTIFQTDEDRKKLENEILGTDDDDNVNPDQPRQMSKTERPYWRQLFG